MKTTPEGRGRETGGAGATKDAKLAYSRETQRPGKLGSKLWEGSRGIGRRETTTARHRDVGQVKGDSKEQGQ